MASRSTSLFLISQLSGFLDWSVKDAKLFIEFVHTLFQHMVLF